MQEKLEVFEGRDVQIGELRLLGSSHELVGQLGYGEEILIVAKAVVSKIEHREKRVEQGGEPAMVRTQRAGIVQFYVVPPEQGERMLAEARVLADERFGIQHLFAEVEGGNGAGDDAGE